MIEARILSPSMMLITGHGKMVECNDEEWFRNLKKTVKESVKNGDARTTK